MSTPITAKMVSELRQRTGAGMMDCKKALDENGGDMEAAIEYLRKRGIAKAEKRSDRSTSEGIVGGEILNNGESGVLVEVACETDFVARNEMFGAFVKALVAQRAQSHAADSETFLAEAMQGENNKTVSEYVKEASARTGEATAVKRVARFDAGSNGQVGMYRHHNGKLATLVQITASSPEAAQHEGTKELAKFIAEHIAAAAPLAVDRSGVPNEKIESERRIAVEQAKEAGKPEAMIEKIAVGKVEAFLKDVTLLPQTWVRDPKQTIADIVKDTEGRVGGKITVDRFVRFQLGADWSDTVTDKAAALRYPRVLLKLSGEALAGERGVGFDFDRIGFFADQIVAVHGLGVQLGLVIGGGNIVRGSQLSQMGMERVGADYMGMLGTVINALALQDVLEKKGLDTRVMTAIRMEELAEPYIRRRALRHFEKGRLVIFAAGTGNPYFSTDTAAALRAIQMKADVIIKATSVDGVYSADPKKDTSAKLYETISYRDVMLEELRVMDQTAITLCKENSLPIIVLNVHRQDAIARAVKGERVGTLVS